MHSASIRVADRVLRLVTTKECSASIVGDLVETVPKKETVRFWLSILKIVFWLSWRPLLAFIAAFYLGNWALGGLQLATYAVNAHRRPFPWFLAFELLMGATVVLCMVMSYAIIRYGVSDRLTQLGLLWIGLFNLILWEWWRPGVPAICIFMTILIIAASLYKREHRRASCALLATIAAGFATWLASMYLTTRWQQFLYGGPWGDAEVRAHPSVLWVGMMTYVAAVWISIRALSRLHKWAIDEQI